MIYLQLEYILRGKQDFLTSKIKLPSGSSGNANDVRTKIDPDTQARLEALLEAAGKLFTIFSDARLFNSVESQTTLLIKERVSMG